MVWPVKQTTRQTNKQINISWVHMHKTNVCISSNFVVAGYNVPPLNFTWIFLVTYQEEENGEEKEGRKENEKFKIAGKSTKMS